MALNQLPGHVLVTGGAGYIGSSLVPMLLKDGYSVTVYDLFLWGVDPLLGQADHPNLFLVKGDINDKDSLESAMSGKDVIIHLAAIVGYPACEKDPEKAMQVNVHGSRNITQLIIPSQKLIFASTGSCYGSINEICTENTEICPLTIYGCSKAEAEKLVIEVGGVVLRLATVFGLSPRLRLDLLVNDLAYKAVNEKQISIYEGSFQRTFIHVTDAARAFMVAMENCNQMKSQIFNVGDVEMNMTKLEVAKLIQQNVKGCTLKESDDGRDMDKRNYKVSYAKIQRFGFKANKPIEGCITDLVKVFRIIDQTDLQKYRNN